MFRVKRQGCCRGSVLLAHLESLMDLKLARMPSGERARILDVMSRYLEHFMCGEENPLPPGVPPGEGRVRGRTWLFLSCH